MAKTYTDGNHREWTASVLRDLSLVLHDDLEYEMSSSVIATKIINIDLDNLDYLITGLEGNGWKKFNDTDWENVFIHMSVQLEWSNAFEYPAQVIREFACVLNQQGDGDASEYIFKLALALEDDKQRATLDWREYDDILMYLWQEISE